MSVKTPTVALSSVPGGATGWLHDPRQGGPGIRLDSAAWVAWLETDMARSFAYPISDPARGYITSYMTVRKEGRTRGSAYWTVYHRCGKQLRKVYLGRSARVTEARLQAIAWAFLIAERQHHGEAPPAVPSF